MNKRELELLILLVAGEIAKLHSALASATPRVAMLIMHQLEEHEALSGKLMQQYISNAD